MGTLPKNKPKLTADEVVRLYEAGWAQHMLALKGKMSVQRIRDILVERKVRIRTPREANALRAERAAAFYKRFAKGEA